MRIDGIEPGFSLEKPASLKRSAAEKPVTSFKETLASFLNDVNAAQKSASDAQVKLLTGETQDVHQVMNKSEEAKTAFNMLMELRNKVLDGYREIERLRL